MKRKIIVRKVGAFGLWEATTPKGMFLGGGFNPEQARYRAMLRLDQIGFARSVGTTMGKQPKRPAPVGRR